MRLTTLGTILVVFLFIFLLAKNSELQSKEDCNLYILHTKNGNIKCNYHNSRDLNNGWMEYIDFSTKKDTYIEGWKIDSITVLSENFWTCGPRDKKIKYIDRRGK